MTLVERDSELRRLDQLLNESRTGTGQVVLVTGPVAAGKTELAMELAKRADAAGVCVTLASGDPTVQEVPYGVIRQLTSKAFAEIEPPLLTSSTPAAADAYGYIQAMCTRFLEDSRPPDKSVLVIVDDIQFADQESLQAILYIIRRLRTAPVMFVFCLTEDLGTPLSDLHIELLRHPNGHRLLLSPLSPAGVAQMISGVLGAGLAERLAPSWHAVSGGNPLLVRALTQAYPHTIADVAAGQTFTDTALACLHRSGRLALDVARGIAVLSPGSDPAPDPDLIARLLGLTLPETDQALAALDAAGLLEGTRFRHPAVGDALLRAPGFEYRDELHYRAAELLETEGAPPARVAEHLVRAGRAGPTWGIAVLLEASAERLRRGDLRFAQRCLELAHRECPPGEERIAILDLLVRAEWQNSPARANGYLTELMELSRRRSLPDRVALTVVKAQLWYGRVDEAMEVLKGVGESPGEGELTAEMTALWAWVRACYPELVPSLCDVFEPRIAPAGRSDGLASDPPGPEGPLGEMLSRGGSPDGVRRDDVVLANVRVGDWWLAPAGVAILDLIYADQLQRAERCCALLMDQTGSRDVRIWRGLAFALRGEIARRNGQILQAEENARAALQHLSSHSWGVMAGIPLANLIATATTRGEYEEAEVYLERAVPEAMFASRFGLHYLEALGYQHLAAGRLQAALAAFLGCGRRMREWDMDLPIIVPWRTGAAETLVRMGERTAARRYLDEQLERRTGYHPRVLGAALRIRAATAEPRQRVSLLREATSLQRNWQSDFELLRALADLSGAYLALGEQRHARTAARRAWRLAERCHAQSLARRLLPANGSAHPAGPGANGDADAGLDAVLSGAEQRVAELASLGHTNREIADKLYITVSTVEQHLTRVYRKLNVSRRVELPDRLRTGNTSA